MNNTSYVPLFALVSLAVPFVYTKEARLMISCHAHSIPVCLGTLQCNHISSKVTSCYLVLSIILNVPSNESKLPSSAELCIYSTNTTNKEAFTNWTQFYICKGQSKPRSEFNDTHTYKGWSMSPMRRGNICFVMCSNFTNTLATLNSSFSFFWSIHCVTIPSQNQCTRQ